MLSSCRVEVKVEASYEPVWSISSGPAPASDQRGSRASGPATVEIGRVVACGARLFSGRPPRGERGGIAAVARPFSAGDHDRGSVVALDAAVQQVQRLADDAARDNMVDRLALWYRPLGLFDACSLCTTLTVATSPAAYLVVHVAHEGGANIWPALCQP